MINVNGRGAAWCLRPYKDFYFTISADLSRKSCVVTYRSRLFDVEQVIFFDQRIGFFGGGIEDDLRVFVR